MARSCAPFGLTYPDSAHANAQCPDQHGFRVAASLDELRKLTRRGVVTLVSATHDLDISHAAVLAKLLNGR